jgi:hypothetical protein
LERLKYTEFGEKKRRFSKNKMVLASQTLIVLSSLSTVLSTGSSRRRDQWASYCNTKVCSKCRSYLVRNYRDRYWVMCSTLARSKKCCDFRQVPSLFTVRDLCTGQPETKFVEVSVLAIGESVSKSKCNSLKNETDFNILNDVFDDFEKKREESSNLCNCDPNTETCDQPVECIDIKNEDTVLRNSSDKGIASEVNEECVIRYTSSETCAIVNQNMQTAKLAEGRVLLITVYNEKYM